MRISRYIIYIRSGIRRDLTLCRGGCRFASDFRGEEKKKKGITKYFHRSVYIIRGVIIVVIVFHFTLVQGVPRTTTKPCCEEKTPARQSREPSSIHVRRNFEIEDMSRKAATHPAARTSPTTGYNLTFTRTVALVLVVAVVLADVINVAECHSLRKDRQHRLAQRDTEEDTRNYMSDGAGPGDEEDESDGAVGGDSTGGGNVTPVIVTSGLVVETTEGTTVTLPCKVTVGSLDEVVLIWINGTNSIMTDNFASSTDPRIKPGTPVSTPGFVEHALIIEQVTRWDSGSYTCKITSSPPVSITHTLRVIQPAKILSVRAIGASGPSNTSVKKFTVKQGDPIQLICNVAGYPEPSVQWTKRNKYQQQQISSTPSPPSLAANQSLQSSEKSTAPVVSYTNEVRIESVVAYRDAGYYECVTYNNGIGTSGPASAPSARSGLELEVEYLPEVTVARRVVNTGETYTAQLACNIHAFPKAKVTFEKMQTTAAGESSWQPLAFEDKNNRFEIFRPTNAAATAAAVNGSTAILPGSSYVLKVKQVQGPQDFGNYRCKAENRLGATYSENITLTGTPAQPITSYVQVKSLGGLSELGWNVDSWSPLIEYQLQYKRQQDPSTMWTDVQPPPQVVDTSAVDSAGDEPRYSVRYVFDDDERTDGQPRKPTLEPGTTYVARLRARNTHGWSEWSADVVTVMYPGTDDDQRTNEISQNEEVDKVWKASTTGGASGFLQNQQFYVVLVATAVAVAMTSFY